MSIEKINYKNLIVCLISSGICGILYGIIFSKIIYFIPLIESFGIILGLSVLTGIAIITLFPVFEKETKPEKRKKQSTFNQMLKNKMNK